MTSGLAPGGPFPWIIVRLQPLREADVIVTLLGAEAGRVDAVARGARSSRKRFAGSLRLFCEVTAVLEPPRRGTLATLVAADLCSDWLGDAVGYDALCLASYATELALHASQPGHADPELHAWLASCLAAAGRLGRAEATDAPGTAGHLRRSRLAVEAGFLRVVGQFPDLAHCARCGAPTTRGAVWPPAAEGPLCPDCAVDGIRLSALALAALARLAAGQPSNVPPPLRPIEERLAERMAQAIPKPLRSAGALREAVAAEAARNLATRS